MTPFLLMNLFFPCKVLTLIYFKTLFYVVFITKRSKGNKALWGFLVDPRQSLPHRPYEMGSIPRTHAKMREQNRLPEVPLTSTCRPLHPHTSYTQILLINTVLFGVFWGKVSLCSPMTRLVLNSQKSVYICLLHVWVKGVQHHIWHKIHIFILLYYF